MPVNEVGRGGEGKKRGKGGDSGGETGKSIWIAFLSTTIPFTRRTQVHSYIRADVRTN